MAEVKQENDKQDVDVRGIGKFLVWLTAGVLGSAALMWFVFDQFTAREARLSPPEERKEISNPQRESRPSRASKWTGSRRSRRSAPTKTLW